MAKLIIITRAGEQHVFESDGGQTIMEMVRDAGVDELLALCGGCCSCATCHVHIDASFADRLPAMTDEENDLLDSSAQRCATSRLSCQVEFDAALDGLCITIAAED